MSSWHTYPSIFNAGHRAVTDLLQDDVIVEEKIDGSQFSFGVFETLVGLSDHEPDAPGVIRLLKIRSKGAEIYPDAPQKMFARAVETVKALQDRLIVGWTYRGEVLDKPKHNALAYDRVPVGHIILFDVNTDEEAYLDHAAKAHEAMRLGLECVPLFYQGRIETLAQFREYLDQTSCLGGQKIEGVVIKPVVPVFGRDKKALMMKFVSEAFKEVHAREWKIGNPKQGDILAILGDWLTTPARWQKAMLHLREAGRLTDDPRDIGLLMKEIPLDVEREMASEIRDRLWEWAWPQLRRIVTHGVPEWYKEQLLARQFEQGRLDEDPEPVDPAQKFEALAQQPQFYAEKHPDPTPETDDWAARYNELHKAVTPNAD